MHTLAQDDAVLGTRAGSRAGSRGALWTGRILSTLAVLFLLLDATPSFPSTSRSSPGAASSSVTRACARSFPGATSTDPPAANEKKP